jgi:hypothetical protein
MRRSEWLAVAMVFAVVLAGFVLILRVYGGKSCEERGGTLHAIPSLSHTGQEGTTVLCIDNNGRILE